MANIKSSIKRAKQNEVRRVRNASARSRYRTYIKNVLKAIHSGEQKIAQEAYAKAQGIIDKAVTKGLIHKNKAARVKSRLVARVKALKA